MSTVWLVTRIDLGGTAYHDVFGNEARAKNFIKDYKGAYACAVEVEVL